MATTNYFNENTGLWEVVEVDAGGFPIIGERIEAINEAEMLYDTAAARQEALMQEQLDEAFMLAGEQPEGFVSGLDVVNKKWNSLTQIPMREGLWPSWIEKEDGWYPPIDYPSNNPFEYMWDELNQAWIKYVSMEEDNNGRI